MPMFSKTARPSYQGYTAATRISPIWHPGYFVYQGGNAKVRTGSLTGGGQIYGHPYRGYFKPVVKAYTPGVVSTTGSGQIPSNPAALLALLGGNYGTGS